MEKAEEEKKPEKAALSFSCFNPRNKNTTATTRCPGRHHRNHQMHDPGAAHEPQAARAPTSSTEDGLLSLTGFLRFGVWVEDGYLSLRAFRSLFLSV